MTPRHCFEFGPFRADLLTHRLLRDGEVVALQPKAFDTLVVLIQNRGRVVERAVLMKTLWPDSFVEEANLTQDVFTLRKALGEQPNGQPYIETVPRRGYFFAADAREIRDAVEAEIGVTLRALESESRPETPSHQPGASTQVPTAHWLTLAAIVVWVDRGRWIDLVASEKISGPDTGLRAAHQLRRLGNLAGVVS